MDMHLEVPDEFPFPFTPYEIQKEFMKNLYTALENKMCAIFESPTGTGKSLSIICGAIKWLKDYNSLKRESLKTKIKLLQHEINKLQSESSDWLSSQSKEIEINRQLYKLKVEDNEIEEYYKKIDELKSNRRKFIQYYNNFKEKANSSSKNGATDIDEEKSIVEDEDLLLEETRKEEEEEDAIEEQEKYTATKIYICSRTHSQLSQFIGEIRKSPYSKDIRVVSLASRQNYCINPQVSCFRSNALINEKCLDMQRKTKTKPTKVDPDGKTLKRQKKKESNCKCPFFKNEAIEELKESIIVDVQDVEDLVATGKELGACPYYASRKSVNDAEVVLVPYNTILHKATREANGIVLTDNIVIIDEAHNLLDALGQMYGATITQKQLLDSYQQLKSYKMRYGKRFSANNLLCINQFLTIISALKAVFEERNIKMSTDAPTRIFTVNDFLSTTEIDHFNMFHLVEFVRNSKISQKLHSFSLRHADPIPKPPKKELPEDGYKKFLASIDQELATQTTKGILTARNNSTKNTQTSTSTNSSINLESKKASSANPFLAVISLLECLQNASADGRILIHFIEEKKLQYLLLNPSSHFSDIVKESRAVIVAGGTMKPMNEFRDRLFLNSGADPSRVMNFSCDHIVPPENILPIILTNQEYLFNYENRFKMNKQIAQILTNACRYVKGGIVVFFPSYKYEAWVWDNVKDVNFGRPIFREPQEAGSVDVVLENYHKAIYKSNTRKAIMFSVVGGKLSEGLNFSDDLGRCVIVFGLPYANINSPDLKEKMTYLDRQEGLGAGKKLYENLCMKAVNQCIGRAVRHINDYATVLLVDVRYNRPATKNALPDWIKRSLRSCEHDKAFECMKEFFALKCSSN